MRHLHRFARVRVLPQPHLDLEHCAHLEFFPALLADVDHHAIHRNAHALIGHHGSAGRLPLLRQRIGGSALGLLQSPKLRTPALAAPPNATARDAHLADLEQDPLGLRKGYQAAQPSRLAGDPLAPAFVGLLKLTLQGEKSQLVGDYSGSKPA